MKSCNEIRIQKFLSEQGIMSRRQAEEAVKRGKIIINGKKCAAGQKIVPEIDEITVDGVRVAPLRKKDRKKIYMMLNKPAGVITTMNDDRGRMCIADILKEYSGKIGGRIYPAGRLDMYSEGLLILTDDGEIANKIMHPKNQISKIYHATLKGELNAGIIKKLAEPIEIEGKMTSPAKIGVIEMKNGKTKLKIEIFEGRNRQIRRMCENSGLFLLKLKRICVGKLNIGTLKPGDWRYLNRNEINYLKEL